MGSDDGSFHPSRGTRSVIMKYNDLEAPFKMWIHLLHEWSLTRSPPCSLVGWLVGSHSFKREELAVRYFHG